MIQMTLVLNRKKFTELRSSIGHYVVFSGSGTARNNSDSANVADGGPVPPGRYYIVDRPTGGRLGPVRDLIRGKDDWFALYREDGHIDDQTYWSGVRRGEFRLHPVGQLGLSTGCVVLQYKDQFNALRKQLLETTTSWVPDSNVPAYGTIDVIALGPNPDGLEPNAARGRRLA